YIQCRSRLGPTRSSLSVQFIFSNSRLKEFFFDFLVSSKSQPIFFAIVVLLCVLCYNFLAQSGFRSYQFGIRYARPLRMSLNWWLVSFVKPYFSAGTLIPKRYVKSALLVRTRSFLLNALSFAGSFFRSISVVEVTSLSESVMV